MAASSSNQAKTQWQPGVPPPQGIYELSKTQKAPLGFRIVVGDRTFFYAHDDDTGIATGKVVSTVAPVSYHTNCAVSGSPAIGATEVTVTMGATTPVTKNMYAEGYMIVNAGTGAGHTYRVKSHPAAAVSKTCKYTLYDPLVVALVTTTTYVSFLENKYEDVKIFTASSQVGVAIGVTPVAVTALTGGYYFWLQTWGPASVMADENYAAYTPLVPGSGVDGNVEAFDADGTLEQVIGVSLMVGVDGEHNPMWLKIRR